MGKSVFILSRRNLVRSPAKSCVVELENVICREFGGELLTPHDLRSRNYSNSIVFFVCLNFSAIWQARHDLARLRQAGATLCCYVFDAWNVRDFFYGRRRRLQQHFHPSYRLNNLVDRLCLPFSPALADFDDDDQAILRHVPLGVDTSLSDGFNDFRPISVLAYGRQPRGLSAMLGQHFNAPNMRTIFHHTDHASISEVHSFEIHRLHFWKLAQSSAVAIAYDPRLTHPERFPMSIVGQRWFECLSAGCAVVGARPTTPEADVLLDWEDSTIELPGNFQEIPKFLDDLLGDTKRLSDIRERNAYEVRKRHDWRFRIADIMRSLTG